MSRFMERWAELLLGHQRLAWLGLAVCTALAAIGASRLTIDDVPSSIFRSGDEDFARLASVWRDFGSDDNDCLVLVRGADVFSTEAARLLRELAARLEALDGVARVVSVADVPVWEAGALAPRPLLPVADAPAASFEAARVRAREHPLVAGKLVSHDGRAALLVVTLAGENLPVTELDRLVELVRTELDEATRGTPFTAAPTGVPVIRRVIFESIARDQRVFAGLGALVGFLVGLAVFRRPGPVLITSGASVLAAFYALGLMGWIGAPINLLNAELPLLVMIIAFTDAVHLMIHVLRRRSEGHPPREAAAEAVRHLGLACALTSFTTAVGFGSLAVSRVELIQRFGILFACATWMSFAVVLTVVPLASARLLGASRRPPMERRYGGLHAPAERLIRAVVGHARAVSVAGVALTLALLLLALRLVPDNRLTESTPRGSPAVETLFEVERAFGGVLSTGVLIEWPEGATIASPGVTSAVQATRAALESNGLFHAPTTVLDLLALLPGRPDATSLGLLPPELVRRYLRPDLRRTIVRASVPDAGSAEASPAYERIAADLEEIRASHPDVELHLTGTAYIARRNVNLMIGDFALGLGVAAAAIFGALALAFRSLRLGAISIVPNAFPLVLAAAVLVLAGLELQVSSVIAFTVCLGIAVDDTIHYLTRFRRELEVDGDAREAAVRAFLGVGRALVVTTLVLLAGFGVLFLSAIPTTQLFAGIGTIGLCAALVGDLLLLPAMVVAFGGRARTLSSRS